MTKIYYTLALIATITLLSGCANNKPNNDTLLFATLYQQNSAEVEALYYQAFNIARLRLDQILADSNYSRPPAIVVDIDETVLDNSPFEAKSILENSNYPKYWKEWCDSASAKATPGAVEFLNYAKSRGVETFYITNRKTIVKESTMKNLVAKGFPCVDNNHMYLRTEESNKKPRRNKVSETHEIVLLMGDNLNDFTSLFDKKDISQRHDIVNQLKNEFGNKFIILPNPMYGAWVDAIYDYKYPEKEQTLGILKAHLVDF